MGIKRFRFGFEPLSKRHSHRWSSRSNPKAKHLVSEPKPWTHIDYLTVKEPNIENTVKLTCNRDATSHGFYLWFDAEISPGIGFSGGPGKNAPGVYGSAFFPWTKPVVMKAGDTAEIHLTASLVSGDYLWQWNTRITSEKEGNHATQSFKQSTFHSDVIGLPMLQNRADSHIPQLSVDGEFEKIILQLMDGKRNLENIARDLMNKYPERFSAYEDTLAFVGNLSEKFSR